MFELLQAFINIWKPREAPEPRWVWDVWGTGHRVPEEPEWLTEWMKPTLRSLEPIESVILDADRYDELEQYLKDLDLFYGRSRPENTVIQLICCMGTTAVLKESEVESK